MQSLMLKHKTRDDVIAHGLLIDVSPHAKKQGFKYPLAVTPDVWRDCVQWRNDDNACQIMQTEAERLSLLMVVAAAAMLRFDPGTGTVVFHAARVKRDGVSRRPSLVKLLLTIAEDEKGAPVGTVSLHDTTEEEYIQRQFTLLVK